MSGWRVLGLLLTALPVQAQTPPDFIAVDGFERLEAFRIDSLVLRDPHFFLNLGFACPDITDTINDQIAIGLDSDDDADGWLDSSPMFLFRPLHTDGSRSLGQTGGGRCSAPAATTSCQPAKPPALVALPYVGQDLGTCLAPIPGTTRPYSPPVATPAGPCFASDTFAAAGQGIGLALPLSDLRSGARRRVNPTPGLADGLLYGFITETAADTLVIDLPLIGPRTLSSLLAGGTGACPAHDDRDTHEGESGWWFYFNYSASDVPYAE